MIRRLFSLPSIVYFILAPIVLGLGVFLFFYENGLDAERTAALSHAAPDPVELQNLTSGDTGSDFNEIVLVAQADVDNMIEMTRTRRGRTRGRELFIPLYSTEATDFSGPIVAVAEIKGTVSDEALAGLYAAEGPAGPVFIINGVLEEGSNSDARKAFEGRRSVAASLYTVKPFLEGREAGLQPTGMGMNLLILGLVIAALLGGFGYFRRRSEQTAKAQEEAYHAEA